MHEKEISLKAER
ncbi:unnamed protein product [Darwinula stevensoni]|uniref:Uncharacterized protein n=1 Tax=Darwinula stevensoni TaxID=69355 RepID=A0A7R9AH25_9CRUS|nr:unnamed protein product [Darwinula stevensoni]CAG0904437.1 unnamed protein product [Darwinula stevensoni]